MATVKEMMMQDAANSVDTAYMMSAGDTFEGTLSTKFDEDWIGIEMTAGMLYTINLSGRNVDLDPTVDSDDDGTADNDNDGVTDTFLKLFDSKGGFIKQNDDVDGAMGELNSSFQFVPEVSGTYYISAGAYTANLGQTNQGAYTVTVTEMPAGIPDPIEGTNMDDKLRGTDAGEKITGDAGNDSLFGLGGDDTLSGGAGHDLLVGGMGGDELSGGGGTDTISYNTSLAGVTINLTDGSARGGDADGDTLVDRATDRIENVVGSGHDDMLTGDRQANMLQGLAGDDMLDGDEGDDTLSGGEGDDVLDGGDEDDTLIGGPGADTLIGGTGADTASYAGSMMGVTVRLHSNKLEGGDAKGDVFSDTTTNTYVVKPDPDEPDTEEVTETVPDIIHLTGSGMDDVLAGDSRDNTIKGGGGDDMIFGGPGGSYDDSDNEDWLAGGDGHDKIYGGKGGDALDGGGGNDTLVGGSGADIFTGGPGSDMIYADRGDTTINGHGVIERDNNGDLVVSALSDPVKMPGEIDTLSYAKFMDSMLEEGVGITLNLSGSAYTTTNVRAGSHDATAGVTNIDHIIGTSEPDILVGRDSTGSGATRVLAPETIEGGDDGDELVGGSGPGDTVSYASSDRGVRVNLGDGGTDGTGDSTASRGHASGDTISGFENVTGSAYGDDLTARSDDTDADTTGTQGSILRGLAGDDTLEGAGGNDTLEGGAGADELDGGWTANAQGQNGQTNTLSYAGSDAGVRVNLATASASGGHADGDEIETEGITIGTGDDAQDIDVATFVNVTGSMHDDHLTGDLFDNQLVGGGGDDSLRGAAGADVLAGGPGADMLDGGEDAKERNNMVPDLSDTDLSDGQNMIAASEDWAAYRGAEAAADGTGVTVNLHTGSGTAGEAMGDELKNIELIWGSEDGDDTFIASAGADVIHGDGGSDTVSYEASRHGVTVSLPTTDDTAQYDADGPDDDADTLEDNGFQPAGDAAVTSWRSGNFDTRVERAPDWAEDAPRPAASYEVERDDDDTTTKSYAEGDILASIENVTGSRRDDMITGDSVPNVLKGGAGKDTLNGGAGDDKLYGGEGDDILGARDTNNDGTFDLDEANDDTLMGGAGNDTLNGGGGSDTLNGGGGNNDLRGGGDADIFVFTPDDDAGSDEIFDFSQTGGIALTDGTATAPGTGDKIDLSAFNIDPGDLEGLLSERGTRVIVNLEDYGGGRITIHDVTLQGLLDSRTDPTSGTPEPHLIHIDVNGDEDGVGGTVDGVTGQDGVFIL